MNNCVGVECENGGQCHNVLNDYHCTCSDDYVGTHCEMHVCDSDENPCQNGGTCTMQDGSGLSVACLCPQEYIGENCDVFACDVST